MVYLIYVKFCAGAMAYIARLDACCGCHQVIMALGILAVVAGRTNGPDLEDAGEDRTAIFAKC